MMSYPYYCYYLLSTYITCAVVLSRQQTQAFPEEVYDGHYQFIQAGDINLGAILSIHEKNHGQVTKPTNDEDRHRSVHSTAESESNDRKRKRENNGDSISNRRSVVGFGQDSQSQANADISRDATSDGNNDNILSTEEMALGVTSIPVLRQNRPKTNTDRPKTSTDGNDNNAGTSPPTTKDPTSMKLCSSKSNTSKAAATSTADLDGTQNGTDPVVSDAPQPKDTGNDKYKENDKIGYDKKHVKRLSGQEDTTNISNDMVESDNEDDVTNIENPTTSRIPIMTTSTTAEDSTEDSQNDRPRDRDPSSSSLCNRQIASFQTLENLASILFALEEINARNDLLPGIRLGVTILDDCFSPSLALARAIQFMPGAGSLTTHQDQQQQQQHHHHQQQQQQQKQQSHRRHRHQRHHSGWQGDPVLENGSTWRGRREVPRGVTLTPVSSSNKSSSYLQLQPPPLSPFFSASSSSSSSSSSSASLASTAKTIISSLLTPTTAKTISVSNSSTSTSTPTPSSNINKMPLGLLQDAVLLSRSGNSQLPTFYDVVGIIGAYTSPLSVVVADVMTIFNLPQISHASTTDTLSDKIKYPFFFRTIPADYFQIHTMAHLLRHFRWNYVSIVFSADAYGTQAEKNLKVLLQEFHICVAQSIELKDNTVSAGYDDVIATLRTHRKAKVVVLYADIKHISPLMAAVRRQNAFREFIWAGSDTTSLASEMEEENCRYIIGSLSITMNASAPPAFLKYLHSYLLQHQTILRQIADKDREKVYALFREFSDEERLRPFLKVDDLAERSYRYVPTFTVSYAIDAVYAYAHAIQALISAKCPGVTGSNARRCVQQNSIVPYLKAVKFHGTSGDVFFDKYGDVIGRIAVNQCQLDRGVAKQVPIASWNAEAKLKLHFKDPLQWPDNSTSYPKSICADKCKRNQVYVFPKQTCCWKCVTCKMNEISIQNKTLCLQCDVLFWPDQNTFSTCHEIDPTYIRMRDILPLSLAVVTTLGLMTSFITAFTFYIYRTDRIIRSTSRELSSLMLVGLFFAFFLVLSLLSTPSVLKCYCNHIGFSLTFTLVYGPLLVKTNRIYRIFTTSRKSAALPKRTSSAWQLLFASGFILIQVIIVCTSITQARPEVKHGMPVKMEKYVIRYCDIPLAGFLPSLAYNLCLVMTCTWYAFKTRRLPDNYNESRYIAFCVDTTLLVWVSFIPTYFAINRPYYRVVILALALLINSIVCLLLLFVPKLYALYLSKQGPVGGRGEVGEFHMQLMSNLSMSGVIRSTPSFLYADNEESEDTVNKGVGADGCTCGGQRRPVRVGSDRRVLAPLTSSSSDAACALPLGVHYVTAPPAAVVIGPVVAGDAK